MGTHFFYLDFKVLFTMGTSLNKILYLQLGHLDSVYPLTSTKVPHLAHLYNSINLQQFVLCF